MASLEDYDEFGNYIGADLDSDDEDDVEAQQTFTSGAPQQASAPAPLEGFEDDAQPGAERMALMEVDGAFACFRV